MTSLFIFDDPNFWRNRAEEMRILAASVARWEAKTILLRVAADYDLLARQAEQAKQKVPTGQDDASRASC
jgi:hypothetical protein